MKRQLKILTAQNVLEAAHLTINLSTNTPPSTTTLTIKQYLRGQGFFACQCDVSQLMMDLEREGHFTFHDNGNFRTYFLAQSTSNVALNLLDDDIEEGREEEEEEEEDDSNNVEEDEDEEDEDEENHEDEENQQPSQSSRRAPIIHDYQCWVDGYVQATYPQTTRNAARNQYVEDHWLAMIEDPSFTKYQFSTNSDDKHDKLDYPLILTETGLKLTIKVVKQEMYLYCHASCIDTSSD